MPKKRNMNRNGTNIKLGRVFELPHSEDGLEENVDNLKYGLELLNHFGEGYVIAYRMGRFPPGGVSPHGYKVLPYAQARREWKEDPEKKTGFTGKEEIERVLGRVEKGLYEVSESGAIIAPAIPWDDYIKILKKEPEFEGGAR